MLTANLELKEEGRIMILLLFIATIGLILWGVIRRQMGWTHKKVNGVPHTDGETTAIAFGASLTVILLLICSLVPLAQGNTIYKLQAFRDANYSNYQFAADETASYLSVEKFTEGALIPIDGSIEKFQLAGYVSERVLEWRDSVNKYNIKVASLKYFNDNAFTGILIPDKIDELELLSIR